MKVTRMAPSPTGEYHPGHLRTVLYNFALAKKENGKFIIRIEDTDRARFVEGATQRILQIIKDFGLYWDEGPEVGGPNAPYFQSQRLDIYKQYATQLLEQKDAYYCFCTSERLAELRTEQTNNKKPPKYDKKCLDLSTEEIKERLSNNEPHVIRLNVPANLDISFTDEVYGQIKISSNDVDDQVLIKSDGFPTYHMAVVVDDNLMGVTHILRGNDWIPSTPKHVLLYKAFNWNIPVYVHLPNLKEKDGTKKLSKRFGSVYLSQFLNEGYLPEAMLNFLMLLGWNPGTEKEIYSIDEFIQDFSIEKVHKTDLVSFDRDKLLWFNGHYIRTLSTEVLYSKIVDWANSNNVTLNGEGFDNSYVISSLSLVKERMKLLSEFNYLTSYFFTNPNVERDQLTKFAANNTMPIIEGFIKLYEDVPDLEWEIEKLDSMSHEFINKVGYKPKEAFMTVRIATTGSNATPPLFDTIGLLGKDITISRLRSALKLFNNRS